MGPKKKWTMMHHPKRPRDDEEQATNDGGTAGSSRGDGGVPQQQEKPKKRSRATAINLGNVKGHQAVVGTCDVRNDRQATAELVDLLNAFADDMYPEGEEASTEGGLPTTITAAAAAAELKNQASGSAAAGVTTAVADGTEGRPASASSANPTPPAAVAEPQHQQQKQLSVEEMVRHEADALRAGKDKSHRFKSVNTFVKGVVMVCVMDPRVDILRLVDAVYAEIRVTGKRRSRFLERVTPMQVTAYSELEAFKTAAESVISAALPPVAEGVPPMASADVAPGKVAGATGSEEAVVGTASSDCGKEAAAATTTERTAGVVAVAKATGSKKEATGPERHNTTAALGSPSDAGGDAGSDGVKQAANGGESSSNGAPSCAKGASSVEVGDAGKAEEKAIAKEQAVETTVEAGEGGEGGGGESATTGGDDNKTCDKRWKFRVDVRRRNSGLKRLDLINAVAGSVGKGHTVSMASPEVTIAVEAVKSVVGASVLFNYALNHEYSISRLQDAVCGAILDS